MGSFHWDHPLARDACCVQFHNGRPLSVALVEADESNCCAKNYYAQHPQRSRSLGRRFHRESFTIHHPNTSYSFVPVHHGSTGNMLVEKLETVTIEEQCQPTATGSIRCNGSCSPLVRQLKIRSRPSSSINSRERDFAGPRWPNYVDEQHEEFYEYHWQHPNRIISNSPSSFRTEVHDAMTSTDDLQVAQPLKPARPRTRDVGTPTPNLPNRPLSKSETQIVERYEQDVKVRRDSISLTDSSSSIKRPLQSSLNDDHSLETSIRKTYKQEYFDRVNVHYGNTFESGRISGTSWRPLTKSNVYSDYADNELIVRPTAKPREALVDTASIVAPPTEITETETKFTFENSLRPIRTYFSS